MSNVFLDANQLYDFYRNLFETVTAETDFGKKLEENGITLKFILHDPDACFWIGPDKILVGEEAERDASISLEMSADVAHDVWLKKLTVSSAILKKKIKLKGSMTYTMKLYPRLKSILEKYPEHCKKHGISTS